MFCDHNCAYPPSCFVQHTVRCILMILCLGNCSVSLWEWICVFWFLCYWQSAHALGDQCWRLPRDCAHIKLIGCIVISDRQINSWFSTPQFFGAAEKIVRVTKRICLESFAKLKVLSFLCIFWGEITHAIALHPHNHMSTKMLSVHFPVRLQLLFCCNSKMLQE